MRLARLRPMASSLMAGAPPQRSMSAARLPATQVGLLRGGMGFLALLDHPAQLGVERRRIRHVEDDKRRGEQGNEFRRVAHGATLRNQNGGGMIAVGA